MEIIALNIATHFHARGIDVHVVTPTPSKAPDTFPFKVSRGLSKRQLQQAVGQCDLVLSNGAGLYIAPHAVIGHKPLIFIHQNYQVTSVEGAGFIYGEVSPLTPWASIFYHVRKRKSLRRVLRDGPKMLVTRFFAKHLVTVNVAISDWMLRRQPLPRQIRIYNPFPIHRFAASAEAIPEEYEADLLFLGRLTAEKGVDTLLNSLRILAKVGLEVRCLLIGDGAYRPQLEALAESLGIADRVEFLGALSGQALLDAVAKAPIAVVPSAWEEPFGGVTTELLAAGKAMIVSERGALAEIVGGAGLLFPNGDVRALADCIETLVKDPALRNQLAAMASTQVERFDEAQLIDQYVALFNRVLSDRSANVSHE